MYEKRYFDLLRKIDCAAGYLAQDPFNARARDNYRRAVRKFAQLCREILEKLMEEDPDVLARLK